MHVTKVSCTYAVEAVGLSICLAQEVASSQMITILDSDNEGCHEGGGDGAHEEPNALTEELLMVLEEIEKLELSSQIE